MKYPCTRVQPTNQFVLFFDVYVRHYARHRALNVEEYTISLQSKFNFIGMLYARLYFIHL